ncbi:hypothetical protein D3C76_791050 [compost metagenome]
MQAQRLVATAPLIARTLGLVDDQRWHAHSLEPRSEPQPTLAAAHDQAVRLGGDAQRSFFIASAFQPVAFVGVGVTMIGTHWTPAAPGFFKALELTHGRQQRPAQALLQTHVAFTSRRLGFQTDPAFEHTVIERRLTFEFPLLGTRRVEACFEHVADGRLAFQGHQVPAEKQQVTPVTLLRKQFQRAVQITLGETLAEVFDPSRELGSWRLQRGFDSDVHGASPDLVVVVTIALEQGSGHLHESPVAERLAQYRPGCGADSCHDFGNGG